MEHLPLIYRVPFAVFHLNHHQNTAPRRRISQPLAEPRCSARPCSSRASCICWGRWMVWSKGWCGGTSILGNLHIYILIYIYICEYYYIYMSIIIYIDIMLVKQSFDGIYRPFMVIWGMVYYCFTFYQHYWHSWSVIGEYCTHPYAVSYVYAYTDILQWHLIQLLLVLHIDIIAYSIIRLWRIFSQYVF